MKKVLLTSVTLLVTGVLCSQDLETYVEEAIRNNPEVQAYQLRYNIAVEKVREVNTIPNTDLGVGYFVSEPETRTGAQKVRVSLKQMLPWFGTITARENYASSLADASYEELSLTKRKLALEVTQSYYRLYAIRAEQLVLDENIELLSNYERLALTSIEVGSASAVDVLRLQIRQNELIQRHKILSEAYIAESTLFNKLLNRDESLAVEVIELLIIPEEDPVSELDRLDLHPELLKYDRLFESVDRAEFLNRKEASPNIGLGVDYAYVEERPGLDFEDNGKDILMPMISLSIPVFNQKYKSRTIQNKMRQQEITYQKNERRNRLQSLLQAAIQNRNSARIAQVIQSENIKMAKDGEGILIKSYETGTIDFNDVLEIQELQLKFQVSQIASVKSYYNESAIVNYLIM